MHLDMPLEVKGHVTIVDDLGNVLLDKDNAVHPQNMSRVIARALSNEHNFFISRIAYGNGGTSVDAAYTITYNTPNDGQTPDVRTWDSRIYNETYSEIIDEGNTTLNPLLGTDPGSAGANTGTRPGGGSNPASDPSSIVHVSGPGVHSNELGLTSEVVITSVLNPGEPTGQLASDGGAVNTESSFSFDEIGLYTPGSPAIDSNGSADVDVGDKTSESDTGLTASTAYNFDLTLDGGTTNTIEFTTPAGGSGTGGEILYGDLCEALNNGNTWGMGSSPLGASTISISDSTSSFPSISGSQTYGFLRITSDTTGSTSSVLIATGTGTGTDLFDSTALNTPAGTSFVTPVDGQDAGVQNAATAPLTERERLLTHIIFSPVLKSANRTLTVTYTLTISVSRSI